MVTLVRDNAKEIMKKGFKIIDTKKLSITTTGYVFEDTPEIRQAIKETEFIPNPHDFEIIKLIKEKE